MIFFLLSSHSIQAHDPVFGLGPHVLFKDGIETALEINANKSDQAFAAGITYGITGDWSIGLDLPYVYKDNGIDSSSGIGDLSVFTKYRFWRKDSLGLQESAAVFLKVINDTAKNNQTPKLDKGVTDSILGFTYGYEGRKNYRWASIRYRNNATNALGIERGDKILLDFVVGIRPTLTGYREADTVWLLELNAEYGKRSKFSNTVLTDTGGNVWFLSPGIFWTKRYFAVKAGVQIPIIKNLYGNQKSSDYQASITFEWHL